MKLRWLLPGTLGAALLCSSAAEAANLQYWRFDRNQNRLDLLTDQGVQPRIQFVANPNRVVIDLPDTKLTRPKQSEAIGGGVSTLRVGQFDANTTRLVVELAPGYAIDPQQVQLQNYYGNQWSLQLPRPRYSPPLANSSLPSSGGVVVPTVPTRPGGVVVNPIYPRGGVVVIPDPYPQPTYPISPPYRPQPVPTPLPQPTTPMTPTPTQPLPRVPVGQAVVAIDAGHGGPDPGAIGLGGLRETDAVLAISKQVAALLEQQGVKAILTRSSDVDLDLEPRLDIADNAGADLFVSIHANSVDGQRTEVNGLETYYYDSGKELAKAIHESVLSGTGMRDRQVRQARFYVLRYSSVPATLVEVGFVTGSEDAQRLSSASGRTQLAQAIARGILNYLQRQPIAKR